MYLHVLYYTYRSTGSRSMAIPRSLQIDLNTTAYYHCMTRCVRRSYLCGYDSETNRDYSHRKQWIVSKIKHLANVFAIKICAYAIMSNHYHLVLFINELQATSWSDQEIIARWHAIFPTDAKSLSLYPDDQAKLKIESWRQHLMDISWFMRCLNEPIARYANKEDDKKGRFWEGRFKSQALLDEGALLSAMVYVDLNPIRAKIADTPENSNFTSIQERLKALVKKVKNIPSNKQPKDLMPFSNKSKLSKDVSIDFTLNDYLKLIDSTGRILREDKRGAIPNSLPPILTRLGLNPDFWLSNVRNLQSRFSYAIGHSEKLAAFNHCHRSKSVNAASEMYIRF